MPTNDFEQLQAVVRRIHNKIVRDDFRDDIDDDNISTPEGALKYACLIKDNDTADMMMLRTTLFYTMREFSKRQQGNIYGFPVEEYQENIEFRPQVVMTFLEPASEAKAHNRRALSRRAGFRLVDETSESITQSNVTTLTNRIKTAFPSSYTFKTGRFKVSYRDPNKGVRLIVSPYTEREGREFVGKVLDVAGVTPDWDKFSVSQYPERNFNARRTINILNESVKTPKRRQIGNVYLKKAVLHIHGLAESVLIYDSPYR